MTRATSVSDETGSEKVRGCEFLYYRENDETDYTKNFFHILSLKV